MTTKRMFSAWSYQALDKHPNLKRLAEGENAAASSSHEKMAREGLISIGLGNRAHNRYSNIVPFDHSLAKCSLGYCNASLVDCGTHGQYVIAAGPMCPEEDCGVVEDTIPDTRDRFWATALENNVSVMVCLARIEPGYTGCSPYVENGAVYGDYFITTSSLNSGEEEEDENEVEGGLPLCVQRLVRIQHRDAAEPTEIVHFQFNAWPNYSGCDEEHLALLVNEVDGIWRSRGARGRIMVNCSGGVGRSGTFVAIHQTLVQARSKAEKGEDVDIDQLAFQQVVHLRQARHPWMVEGEHQFRLISAIAKRLLLVQHRLCPTFDDDDL